MRKVKYKVWFALLLIKQSKELGCHFITDGIFHDFAATSSSHTLFLARMEERKDTFLITPPPNCSLNFD